MKKVGNFFYIVFFILLLVLTYLSDTHQTIGRKLIYCEKCGEILEHEKSPYTWQSLGAMILPEYFVEKNVLN